MKARKSLVFKESEKRFKFFKADIFAEHLSKLHAFFNSASVLLKFLVN